MRIELIGTDLTEADANRLGGVIGLIEKQMGMPEDAVREVIFASDEKFGEVVLRFDPTGTYTNARGLVAAGKTFAHREPGKPTTTSVLLRHGCATHLLKALDSTAGKIDEWPTEQQMALYILAHELGHCLDHTRREASPDDGTYRNEQGQRVLGHSVADLCTYYYSMLVSELSACVFSSPYYTEALRKDECRMNNDFVFRQLETLRNLTRDSSDDLNKIQGEAGGLFWFVLMQQAKQSAVRIGNGVMENRTATELWEFAQSSESVAEALVRADGAIVAAWESYPAFGPELKEQLTGAFHEMAAVHSFRFHDAAGRDGIWWNTLFQKFAFEGLQRQREGAAS